MTPPRRSLHDRDPLVSSIVGKRRATYPSAAQPFMSGGAQPSGFLQTPQMQQMMSQASPDNQRFVNNLFAYNDRQAGLQQAIAQGRGPRHPGRRHKTCMLHWSVNAGPMGCPAAA
jgi:hypothetical protein